MVSKKIQKNRRIYKKTSKKGSKKRTTKKGSKKRSKKTLTKKGSKKGSKKRTTKKGSKKRSKKMKGGIGGPYNTANAPSNHVVSSANENAINNLMYTEKLALTRDKQPPKCNDYAKINNIKQGPDKTKFISENRNKKKCI